MTTEDEVMRLLERADPVRARRAAPAVDSASYLDALRTRNTNATTIETAPTPTRRPSRHRRPILITITAAAAVVAILVGALVLTTRDDNGSQIAARPRTTGLPPERGELVAAMWSHASADPSWGDAWFYVYADGRLISYRYPYSPGWLEQRLTPEGVELVRAEILSTGLFDLDRPPPGSELGLGFPYYGDIEVRNHDRLVYVPRRPDQEWTNEFDRLHERLRNLDSWLPPNAWQDPTVRPYEPSTYAICLSTSTGTFANQPRIRPSRILSLLPAPAEELLAGARHWRWQELASEDPGTTRRVNRTPLAGRGNPHCFDETTEEARALTKALDDAGIDHDTAGTLIYRFRAPDPVSRTVDILFLPYLPHGVPATTGG